MADEYEFTLGSPWYQPYVDYALNKGLIKAGQFTDYTAAATRADFASIIGSLPSEMLNIINDIPDQSIPEIPIDANYKNQAYLLYRAGILVGNDASGSFHPESHISRGEVSAIITRTAIPVQRKNVSLTVNYSTLYADDGSSLQVPQWACDQYLSLGWRTAPFTVSSAVGAKEILNAATLKPTLTNYAELDAMVDNLFAEIFTPDMSTYDKVKACYDYLINHTEYGFNNDIPLFLLFGGPYNQDTMDGSYVAFAYGVLQDGVGVCDDYAATFLVLTRRIGLESYVFGGQTSKANGGYTPHAWNVITIGGTDYVFDVQVEDNIAKGGPIQYYRFCKTFDEVAINYIDYDAAACKSAFGGFAYEEGGR